MRLTTRLPRLLLRMHKPMMSSTSSTLKPVRISSSVAARAISGARAAAPVAAEDKDIAELLAR